MFLVQVCWFLKWCWTTEFSDSFMPHLRAKYGNKFHKPCLNKIITMLTQFVCPTAAVIDSFLGQSFLFFSILIPLRYVPPAFLLCPICSVRFCVLIKTSLILQLRWGEWNLHTLSRRKQHLKIITCWTSSSDERYRSSESCRPVSIECFSILMLSSWITADPLSIACASPFPQPYIPIPPKMSWNKTKPFELFFSLAWR